ncbi:acyl-CoA thioesterase [Fictibacillus sp. WQ 8-8]|uniref:acyl-CoA thioesterase n=1 Tax=unclassified Fictibacillus TaxID=2644029 RepID=UPI0006A7E232|nr:MULTISPECIES: acyl-CoA thioesterase [unclassified Fictibacillus]MCQ6265268.1 acyl-CoA thioesterase [Fictibacillus sp. WQ 8-8]MED2971945.1 acyl-CoA thioesterase [Fictibacillus sp. B-59209]UZJ77633.1 acyl-CoA thioesterase [Fictibacillus sp. KU28468]SFE00816.1 Acyl-CoA hydrolase [Bacillus sp. OV194]
MASQIPASFPSEAKTVQQSKTCLTDLVFPPDTNHHHTVFGGKVMAYVDKIACITAMRHCRKPVVTVSSDSFEFLGPIKTGEAINLEAYVTCAHRTSMEIFVKVESENLLTGEKRLTSRALFTMLAVDAEGRPSPVPPLVPVNQEEIHRYQQAKERYEKRKKKKA